MERGFYVLAYDIADNRRRQKIAKCCEAVADRVQESVFEAYLSPTELEKLVKRTAKWMKAEEDSLRIYYLCQECQKKVSMHGIGILTPPPSTKVI